jgi:hypothetical protein
MRCLNFLLMNTFPPHYIVLVGDLLSFKYMPLMCLLDDLSKNWLRSNGLVNCSLVPALRVAGYCTVPGPLHCCTRSDTASMAQCGQTINHI